MNKTDLTKAIAAKAGLTQGDAKKALDSTLEAITDALKSGDEVALIGLGTFAVAERSARQGINPQTKAVIKIEAKKQAKFKAGAELEAAIQ
jgi:DNA-binding protein HU-beta